MNPRWKNRLLAKVYTAFPALASRWGRKSVSAGGAVPWTVPRRPLAEAAVALVTTGGVHLRSQPPFDMVDPDGDPTWREVPIAADRSDLTITHDYYDHHDAERDLNLVSPAERLREMAERGVIGALHPIVVSFMGHIDGRHVETLRAKTAPEAARRLAAAGVDYALLVPA